MGRETFSRDRYEKSVAEHAPTAGPVTHRAEQQARASGKLHPLVDPKGLPHLGSIRLSLPRFEAQPNGLWLLTVGTPIPVETRVDTTASMGNNVDVALRVLPQAFELISEMLPGCDLQMATGIFGDIGDSFPLCRPQFEAEAGKIVQQLTLMVPERAGGDIPEDPHYGLFGAAYLTAPYLTRIGLKSYDFTVSDAPARDELNPRQLIRIFGEDVFSKAKENGAQIEFSHLPDTATMVKRDLLARAHAFFLQVKDDPTTYSFWSKVFGADRVVVLPSTEFLPQVQAVIIGLTEGTLSLNDVTGFLVTHGVHQSDASKIARSVANIPIGAQAALPNFGRRPQAGDLFRDKSDLWPLSSDELALLADSPPTDTTESTEPTEKGGIKWL